MAKLINYEGKLAIDFGWHVMWVEPKECYLIKVSEIKASDYPEFMGQEVEYYNDTPCVYHPVRGYQIPIHSAWHEVRTERPVKKPRDTQYYTHRWDCGRWLKVPK